MKLGRKPPVHTRRTMRSALILSRYLDPLGAAPADSNDYVSAVNKAVNGDWGMMGNDQWGDCVEADTGHSLMLRTANTGTIVIPTTQDIEALYTAVTGFNPNDPNTDQGTDETTMCQYMETTGLLGHKSDGTAMVDTTNLDHVKWSMQLFGALRLGMNVPDYCMDQFNSGKPWDVVGDPQSANIEGGHDVPLVKYDSGMFYVVTWGKIQAMTPNFFKAFVDEAHAEVYADWIKSTGVSPSGFGLDALLSDLKGLAVSS